MLLVFLYLVAFAFFVSIRIGFMNGTGITERNQYIVQQEQILLLNNYFDREGFSKVKTFDEFYDFVKKLQWEKLWVKPGHLSAYSPMGATRIFQ
jgi:hypothetical protein